jgi:hypothetical protein
MTFRCCVLVFALSSTFSVDLGDSGWGDWEGDLAVGIFEDGNANLVSSCGGRVGIEIELKIKYLTCKRKKEEKS